MDNMKNVKKMWLGSLSLLDNCYVNAVIIIILVLYCSRVFDNINSFVGNLYNLSIIRFIVLLLIIYVAYKDSTIAILLAVSYIISLYYMDSSENFSSMDKYNSKYNKPSSEMESFKGSRQVENFFPIMNNDSSNFDMTLRNVNKNSQEYNMAVLNGNNNQEKFDMTLPNVNSFNMNSTSYDMALPNLSKGGAKVVEQVPESCMQNYVPRFESVGDVCSPTATFKNELNAQGLNFPEGFNDQMNGSPLNL
jgi:hypothetical protein